MSDLMRPIPFGKLVEWMRKEFKENGSIFGIRKNKIYKSESGASRELFGTKMTSILGPAAGPHSQLAQNIIVAYLTGSRFIELKTVQIMDGEELRKCVPKPCIDAEDECYNMEWSTEMTVPEAYDEYLKAWLALHILQKELGISDKRDFVFNMSVGYDLKGIQSPKVDTYIEQMKDATKSPLWKEYTNWMQQNMDVFQSFTKEDMAAISPVVCDSITLSTLHGCPPDEIERIASYLLDTKKIHTYVKCNPTLLGYKTARNLMDSMGYAYIAFDDHHFNADLQWKDAVPMFRRLTDLSKKHSLAFGLKLTNTFPVQNTRTIMKGDEMYMSGRSLFPLTITLAQRISEEFNGEMPISYSGGADIFNLEKLAATGIYPITMATTLLKPGGYNRIQQLAKKLEPLYKNAPKKIDAAAVAKLAAEFTKAGHFLKGTREYASYKTSSPLPLYDCFKSPCKSGGCPIEQQVPEYLRLVAQGKFDEAIKIITIDNATPAVLSKLCDHQCQSKCTRMDYEESLHIRNMKNVAVMGAQDALIASIKPAAIKTDKKAVVIGAGPAGIATALFLRRNGMQVVVKEKNAEPFGIVRYAIPSFRITQELIDKDFRMAKKAGVEFEFNVDPNYSVKDLQKEYDYVVLATGAWQEGPCPVKTGGEKLRYALEFLQKAKLEGPQKQKLGKRIAVIGAGDVAMDCARTAKRAEGAEEVVIVYRRTREFMPAMKEELDEALHEGVKLQELLAPLAYDGKTLTCEVMQLSDERDASGRRKVKSTGQKKDLQFDTVVASVGAQVCSDDFIRNGLSVNERNLPKCDTCSLEGGNCVYFAGDCVGGPSTIVRAVANAKAIAKNILSKAGLTHDFVRTYLPQNLDELYSRKGVLITDIKAASKEDGNRCLTCDQLCEICNDVCPNRANVYIKVKGNVFSQPHQIIHLDGMCNECGNCGTFCPHAGRPYKDKVTVFWTEEDFTDSTNKGFLSLGNGGFKVRDEHGKVFDHKPGDGKLSTAMQAMLDTLVKDYPHYVSI